MSEPSMSSPIKVAFANLASSGWTAGGHYLINLFTALRSVEDETPVHISLLSPQGTPAQDYALLQPFLDGNIQFPETRWGRWVKSFYLRLPLPGVLERYLLPRKKLIGLLQHAGIQAIYSNDEYGPDFPLPLVCWIPDFQHVHLPEMFSPSKVRTRLRHHQRVVAHADLVVLSCQDVKRDFVSIAPQASEKARVMPFVAQIPSQVYTKDAWEICQRYNLPSHFFYLPNQFWPHKNHQTVIDALDILRNRSQHEFGQIRVVATGNRRSFQGTATFDKVMARVQELGLQEHFQYIGMIPHEDVIQLMRQSLAVLQPSLFEGWSTIVEEVRSLGKTLLLSDIPANREQSPPATYFFDPHNPQMLAEILLRGSKELSPGADLNLEAQARQQLPVRTKAYGRVFLEIIREACR